jgi:LTXXQ motif family protein
MNKTMIVATMLSLAASGNPAFAQAPAAEDPHHPSQAATPAPPTTPSMVPDGMMGGMRMMNMIRMMGMARGDGTDTIDRVEGRIAFLHTELKITDEQSGTWNAFADALRANAKKLGEVPAAMAAPAAGQRSANLDERLESQERWLLARLEGTRTIRTAFVKLNDTLSDDQKKAAGELLVPHMGMGMMGPMGGPMQPGQMRPSGM